MLNDNAARKRASNLVLQEGMFDCDILDHFAANRQAVIVFPVVLDGTRSLPRIQDASPWWTSNVRVIIFKPSGSKVHWSPY